jgi:hypothetical protein
MSMQARYLEDFSNKTAFDYFTDDVAKKAIYIFLKSIIISSGYESSYKDFDIRDVLN